MTKEQLPEKQHDAKELSQLITLMMKLPEEQGGILKKAIRLAKQLASIEPIEGHRAFGRVVPTFKKVEKTRNRRKHRV